MTTHAEPDAPDTEAATDPDTRAARLRPHHVAIGLGVGIALFTVASGIVPQITDWHNENAVHREVFVNVPGALQVAFYTVIPIMLVWGAFRFADRMKNWSAAGRRRRAARPRRTPATASPTSAPACTCGRCCATRPPG